jgi:hypothetical protein
VFDHKVGELLAVDEHNAHVQAFGRFLCTLREIGGGDEYPFARALSRQRADELVDLGAVDGVFPALGL